MRLFKRDHGGEPAGPAADAFQPKLWVALGGLVLVAAYAVAFVVANDTEVDVSFVVFSARTSVIWVILLSLAIGLVAGALVAQLYRRRSRS